MVVTIQFPHRRIPNQLNSIAFGSIIAFCTRCVTVNRPLRESEKASTTDARFINDSLKRARVRLLMFVGTDTTHLRKLVKSQGNLLGSKTIFTESHDDPEPALKVGRHR